MLNSGCSMSEWGCGSGECYFQAFDSTTLPPWLFAAFEVDAVVPEAVCCPLLSPESILLKYSLLNYKIK